jgi:adenine-specific DNA glycosylase
VDTHIFRVSNRTGIAPGKNPLVVEEELNKVTPEEFKHNAHHWLLLHGRYVCLARVPACPKCIINDLCEYTLKTLPKDLPKSEAPVARAAARAPKQPAKAAATAVKSGKPTKATRQSARAKSAKAATRKRAR